MHLKAICIGDFGKLTVPINDIVADLQAVEFQFRQILPHVVFQHRVFALISGHISETCKNVFSDALCDGTLLIARLLYLKIRLHSELPQYLQSLVSVRKRNGKKSRKLAKLQHI